MPRRTRAALAAVLVTCALAVDLVGIVPGAALAPSAPVDSLDGAADVLAPAESVPQAVDVVSVTQRGGLTLAVRTAVLQAAAVAKAPVSLGRGFQLGMTRLRRGNTVLQQSTGTGWGFPMAVTALPVEAIAPVMGRAVSGPVSMGQVVMGRTSADLRGAQAGDTIELMASWGGIATFTIGYIAPDSQVGGTELVMSTQMATSVGMNSNSRVLMYGQFDRAALDAALAARGIVSSTSLRVSHSWDPAGPDDTMGLAATKVLLGEFDLDYAHLSDSGWTAVGAEWRATYLPATRETYSTGLRAMCNAAVRDDVEAALAEVLATHPELVNNSSNPDSQSIGLDIANANQYGGCATGQARLSRVGISGGIVSRHSWGQALDVSTAINCQGCVPVMSCDIVRIFRKHGFAWGGNFLTPDGMHFEWVGERRDQIQTAVRYCANLPLPPTENVHRPPPPMARDTLFADDGWTGD